MGQLALAYAIALKYDVTVLGDNEDKAAIEALGGKFQELSSNGTKFNAVLICTATINN